MAGSSFGTLFCMTTWGETHGKGVGVVVDGCPAGLSLCEEDIQKYILLYILLTKRKACRTTVHYNTHTFSVCFSPCCHTKQCPK